MKKIFTISALTLSATFFLGFSAAQAVPNLQLDIVGGTYDPITDTIVTSDSEFTLVALLSNADYLDENFYISSAILPKMENTPVDLGSFTFDGKVVNVTSDMQWGVPPANDPADGENPDKDLAPHGAFPTYFYEYEFTFDAQSKALEYDSESTPGGLVPDTNGTLYYMTFTINRLALDPNLSIHFDLYNIKGDEDLDAGINAPFSHDAQSNPIPEPATMLLFGTGLAGLAGVARRRTKK